MKLQAAIIVAMSTAQIWDPASYARNARFVSDLGAPVVDLLAPKPGERILDLGCGDGVLTKKLADLGCEVVAVDSSLPQIEAARKLGLNASVISGEDLPYKEEFDAVFSNAVLHWIRRADVMLAGVYRSLKPGGRFVAECGGHGCVQKIRTALVQALERRGFDTVWRSERSVQRARVPETLTQDRPNIIITQADNAEPSSGVQTVSCLPSARPQTKQGRPARSVCTA
jgi:trans-aconitate methyltransferase